MNLTVEVPKGTTQHGNPHILCIYAPAGKTALSIATFLATNYIAHAATVKSSPGEDSTATFLNVLMALLFPMSGLMRALNAIARAARFGGSELRNACRAGALCMVIRSSDWYPAKDEQVEALVVGDNEDLEDSSESEEVEQAERSNPTEAEFVPYLPSWGREDSSYWAYFDTIGSGAYVDPVKARIHGKLILPRSYTLAIVPRNACLRPIGDCISRSPKQYNISSSYSLAKALASLVQVLAALGTLLSHRSDLVTRWGYASYHLTVVPYLAMTILNFISNMLTADYPYFYMVESDIMNEARARHGVFEGAVARLYRVESSQPPSMEEVVDWNGFDYSKVKAVISQLSLGYLFNALAQYLKRDNQISLGERMTLHCLGVQQRSSEPIMRPDILAHQESAAHSNAARSTPQRRPVFESVYSPARRYERPAQGGALSNNCTVVQTGHRDALVDQGYVSQDRLLLALVAMEPPAFCTRWS